MRLLNMDRAINPVIILPLLLFAVVAASSLQSVRLADSPANITGVNEGRIEVWNGEHWQDVCHRKWDHRDAGVVCRQIGFSGASFAMVESHYGNGQNNISIQNFDCGGDEATLQECPSKESDKTCRDGETAGASCFLPGYLGCYLDRTVGSVLSGASLSSDDMTVRKCLQYCHNQNMRYAGLRENTKCYCGANGTAYDAWGKVSNTNCMNRCSGNQAEACGGSTTWFWTTSVYDVNLARCPKPQDPSFGFVNERGALWFGSTATFGCYDGFKVDKKNTLTCVLGKEVNKLVWLGEYSTCEEIPDPLSRNVKDETNRIDAQAIYLKGTKGTVKEEEISSIRFVVGSLVGFLICLIITATIVIVYRKERKAKRSPKIKRQEEGNGQATGYHLANGGAAGDTKI